MEYRLLRSLEGVLGSDGRYWILVKDTLLKPVSIAATQRSSKTLTKICCHHRRPREVNVFHVSNKDSIIEV
jgi:hypothetical protein